MLNKGHFCFLVFTLTEQLVLYLKYWTDQINSERTRGWWPHSRSPTYFAEILSVTQNIRGANCVRLARQEQSIPKQRLHGFQILLSVNVLVLSLL